MDFMSLGNRMSRKANNIFEPPKTKSIVQKHIDLYTFITQAIQILFGECLHFLSVVC